MIGNGMGRARGKRKLTFEETMRWRTVLLSTSEKPIERMLAAARIAMPKGPAFAWPVCIDCSAIAAYSLSGRIQRQGDGQHHDSKSR